jgi:hypothetical protein
MILVRCLFTIARVLLLSERPNSTKTGGSPRHFAVSPAQLLDWRYARFATGK